MIIKEVHKESGTEIGIVCEKRLYRGESKYQKIEVFSSKYYGNVLRLDDCFMMTEKNSDQYHQNCLKIIKKSRYQNILIVGGGDFGIAKLITETIDFTSLNVVEIDKDVITVCRKFFPLNFKMSQKYKERINIIVDDGFDWLSSYKKNKFDLVILDCTDPDTQANTLYSEAFYKLVEKNMKKNALFIQQSGSPLLNYNNQINLMVKNLKKIGFINIRTNQFPMPIYPLGTWSFTHCKKA